MRVSNNKGFSLIEVLVTVGLIGILVGIAIPSYNGYKQNTVSMALKADLGNGAKAYNAQYAVESSYCYPFSAVGLNTNREGNPIYKKRAFYGFEGIESDCGSVAKNKVQYKTAASYCATSATDAKDTGDNKASCSTPKVWKRSADRAFSGTVANCKLDSNRFRMGATTNVSGLKTFLTVDQDGRVSSGTANCDSTGW